MSAVRSIFPVKAPYPVCQQPARNKPAPRSPVPVSMPSRAVSGRAGRGGPRVGSGSALYLDTVGEQSRIELRKAARIRIKMQVVEALKSCGRDKESVALLSCGLWFRLWESKCGSKRLLPCSCDHPLCADCSRERSFPLQRKIFALTRNFSKSYKFLTFTLKNVYRIDGSYVRSLSKFLSKVRKLSLWKKWITGGVYSVETTYNEKSETWHVHLHAIVEVSHPNGVTSAKRPFLPKEWIFQLQGEWLRITGDSHVVNLKSVNRKAVKELVKYQAKAADFAFSGDLVDEYLTAFAKVRRIQTFGSFQGKAKEKTGEETEKGQLSFWKCDCGHCLSSDWKRNPVLVHMKNTNLDILGNRVLIAGYDSSPPKDPFWDFFFSEEQKTNSWIGFAGVLPIAETQSAFAF